MEHCDRAVRALVFPPTDAHRAWRRGPAGHAWCVAGRGATFAVVVWLAAWAMLHARWRTRDLSTGAVFGWTLVLVALSLVLTFPPVWEMF